MSDPLIIAGKEMSSRLILGTGKYATFELMKQAVEMAEPAMVTVALRRVNLTDKSKESLLDYIDTKRFPLLPNTAGCYNAEDALRTARLGRELGLSDWVKLEIIADERTLLPETHDLVKATETLVKEGFIVMPYTNDDPVTARKLIDVGAACVMPLAAPIGSGRGVQNRLNLQFIVEESSVPVIVDAGVGTASDASVAMELGAGGVLMNTAVAAAKDPVKMAEAMKLAVRSGHLAFEAGRMPMKEYASPSSPTEGKITS